MKKLLILLIIPVFLTSCGVHSGLTNQFSLYGNNTNVILEEANYTVIGQVTGEASHSYFFGFGGMKNNLISMAKKSMYESAGLEGKSRAIINVTLETHKSTVLFSKKLTVVVHGTIIEFD